LKYSPKQLDVTLLCQCFWQNTMTKKHTHKFTYYLLYSSFHSLSSKCVDGLDDSVSTPLHPYKQRTPCTPTTICSSYTLVLLSRMLEMGAGLLSYFVYYLFLNKISICFCSLWFPLLIFIFFICKIKKRTNQNEQIEVAYNHLPL